MAISVSGLRLGGRLRRLRGDRPLSEVVQHVKRSAPTISRVERGVTPVDPLFLGALLAYYEVPVGEQANYLALLETPPGNLWWRSYESHVDDPHLDHIALESEASKISTWEPVLVPALLQTEAYARAIMHGAGVESLTEDTITARLELRLGRQDRLTGDSPLEFRAFIDESVLMRPVGGRHVLKDQITHLLTMTERPNITIRVVPLEAGVHAGMTGSVTLLEYADDDVSFGFQETASGDMFLDQERDLRVCRGVFGSLATTALDVGTSIQEMVRLAS